MSLLDYEFGLEYDVMLSAWGEGVLSESSLPDFQQPDVILKKYKKEYRRMPESISLYIQDPMDFGYDYGYTGVASAFLEKIETLKELNNNTMIRSTFDSFAESFARENKLRFRHSDFVFAEYELEYAPESTRLIMQFRRDGSVVIKEDVSSPGTSASNTLGGSFYHKLNKEFHKTNDAEEIADMFSKGLRDAILKDGRLSDFIAKAKTHNLFTGNHR